MTNPITDPHPPHHETHQEKTTAMNEETAMTNNSQQTDAAQQTNIADYIIASLATRGVRHIYGYPGAAIMPLMAAIDRSPDVDWVLMRHEASAALAATAEARLTGRIGVCMTSSGPGATNLTTGIIDATLDRAPIVAITGMVPTWKRSRSGFQDLDQAQLFSSMVPLSTAVGHPDQVPGLLRDHLSRAEQQRESCHIAVPVDIQSMTIEPGDPRFEQINIPKPLALHPPPRSAFGSFAKDLCTVDDVLIVVGPRAVGAGPQIERLAEHLRLPMITSLDAKGIIDETHPNHLGVLGIFGSPGVSLTRDLLDRTEGILAIGVDDLGGFVADQSGVQCKTLFQIEPDFSSVSHRFHRTRSLVGPIGEVATTLARISVRTKGELLATAATLRESFVASLPGPDPARRVDGQPKDVVHPRTVLESLGELLDPDGVIALDVGDNTVWAAQFLTLADHQRVLTSSQLGTMGFSLPAAIAAKLEAPDSQVVAIAGDGAFQMVMGELMTAVQSRLPLVQIVFVNERLQRVVAQQGDPIGTEIVNPDFVALAEACGARGLLIADDGDAHDVLKQALFDQDDRPTVVACMIGPDIQAPMSAASDSFTPLHFG